MENKKFAKKTDIIIIGVILVVALAGLLYLQLAKQNQVKDDYNYIAFNSGGEVKELFYLGDYEEQFIVDLGDKYPVSGQLEFKDHKARFINVTCPDHICESIGWISEEYDGAVCIPNRMSITVVTPEEAKEIMQQLDNQ